MALALLDFVATTLALGAAFDALAASGIGASIALLGVALGALALRLAPTPRVPAAKRGLVSATAMTCVLSWVLPCPSTWSLSALLGASLLLAPPLAAFTCATVVLLAPPDVAPAPVPSQRPTGAAERAMTPAASLAALALVAGATVAVEVLLTRLFSVMTWYGLTFFVLSIAMLGLTRGSLAADEARRRGEPIAPWVAARLVVMAVGVLALLGLSLNTPLSISFAPMALLTVVTVTFATTLPLVAGGGVVARLMAESGVGLPRMYAVDLVSAAAGALLPLALLGPLSAQAGLCAIAAALALGGALLDRGRWRRGVAVAVALAAAGLCALASNPRTGLLMHYMKSGGVTSERATFRAWNAISYVSLSEFGTHPTPFLWGASSTTPPVSPRMALARIDGEAGTPVYEYQRPSDFSFLSYDVTAVVHALRPTGVACVIGVGGGRDLLAALSAGHERVIGVEINPAMVAMMRAVRGRAPLLDDPRVTVLVGDGRERYAHLPVRCSVLQASLVDTWAATSAGAFAHVEATLYTREAWAIFLNRVTPAGVVTFSRWYDASRTSETSRLVSLAVASLLDRGARDPRRHVALVATGRVATILVSPSPLSPDDLARLEERTTRMRFDVLFAPGRPPRDPLLARLLESRSIDDLAAAGRAQRIDTSAPTDDRPFFFQLLTPAAWLDLGYVLRAASGGGVIAGNVTAIIELLVTLLAVLLASVALLGPTLYAAARAPVPPIPGARAAVYFASLGAGFMLAEVALIQRMHVVLGHPTLSLIVVLASLLVATGVGSAASPRVAGSARRVSAVAALAAALLGSLPAAVIGPLAARTAASPFWVRALWVGACAAAVGLLLGALFPAGLRYVARARGAPVALAVNGAAGVVGSVVAIVVSIWGGVTATFLVAAGFYLLAAACGPCGWPAVDDAA